MKLQKVTPGKFHEELLPLLIEMNKAGIKTIASCIGDELAPAFIAIDMKSLKGVRIFPDNMLCLDFKYNGSNHYDKRIKE